MNSKMDCKSIFTKWTILVSAGIVALCLATSPLHGQEKRQYQAGTIVDVKPHQTESANSDATNPKNNEPQKYDISFKVGNRVYVVLYTPPLGQNYPELGLGMDRTVFVDGDTMKVNDLLGRTRSMPILSSKDAPPKSTN
jgi:hypothetical protein